jgi:hypothetical protein
MWRVESNRSESAGRRRRRGREGEREILVIY